MNDVSTFSADVAAVDTKIEKAGLSLYLNQVPHQTGAYPGYCRMKRLRVFVLCPGCDASPSQGYPQH